MRPVGSIDSSTSNPRLYPKREGENKELKNQGWIGSLLQLDHRPQFFWRIEVTQLNDAGLFRDRLAEEDSFLLGDGHRDDHYIESPFQQSIERFISSIDFVS